MPVVLSATWIAKPGEEEKVREAIEHLSPASREEPGNLYYQAYQSPEEPNVFRIFEIYEDQDAVTAHTQYPHFVTWAAGQALPALEERRRDFYQTLDY
ncbi:putative quinol monooxygenase [Demequina pelophila]|uniref:putative quinol monooxygenase n=1 Tax=Demequina pelophila TaxID=1638984 RepID=UPI00078289F4|nr:putative quinol monooxygenase [Demequina pelophila]